MKKTDVPVLDLSVPAEPKHGAQTFEFSGTRIDRVIGGTRSIATRWFDLKGRPPGFDYMRIALSVSVLLWHSYLVSYGVRAALDVWDKPAGLVLQFILPMFFCLSGFLVYGSLERNPNLLKFLALRVIRLYPALCVEVIASALILGPIVTSFTLGAYVTSPIFFAYFANTLGLVHFTLPGVFLNNPLPDTVNATLWTVPYELQCYILLSVLVLIGFMRSRSVSLVMFLACTVLVLVSLAIQGRSGSPPGHLNGRVLVLCFLAGTIIFRFRDLIPYSGRLAVLSTVLAAPMLRYDVYVRIPMKPAMHSERKPATCSDLKPAGVPI